MTRRELSRFQKSRVRSSSHFAIHHQVDRRWPRASPINFTDRYPLPRSFGFTAISAKALSSPKSSSKVAHFTARTLPLTVSHDSIPEGINWPAIKPVAIRRLPARREYQSEEIRREIGLRVQGSVQASHCLGQYSTGSRQRHGRAVVTASCAIEDLIDYRFRRARAVPPSPSVLPPSNSKRVNRLLHRDGTFTRGVLPREMSSRLAVRQAIIKGGANGWKTRNALSVMITGGGERVARVSRETIARESTRARARMTTRSI